VLSRDLLPALGLLPALKGLLPALEGLLPPRSGLNFVLAEELHLVRT
jgi:hypothetical protein